MVPALFTDAFYLASLAHREKSTLSGVISAPFDGGRSSDILGACFWAHPTRLTSGGDMGKASGILVIIAVAAALVAASVPRGFVPK